MERSAGQDSTTCANSGVKRPDSRRGPDPRRKFAEVAVNAPTGRTFSYSIPPQLVLAPGQAVWVPFGPRLLQGVIFEVTDQPSVAETREISGVIDPVPLLSPAQVELA